jgi:hypothetical protein
MQAATIGVAFGQNSDITAEAADAVVLETSLAKVDELIHITPDADDCPPQCRGGYGVEHDRYGDRSRRAPAAGYWSD